jgi:hypothetical protein
MDQEKYNCLLLAKIDELKDQINQLKEKIQDQETKLKRKWRADIKKELEVYTYNSYASDMDGYKKVEYSD